MDSTTALIKCSFCVALVIPKVVPRTLLSQYGVPSPTKAGTKYTPLLSGILVLYFYTSDDFSIILNPSLNH